MIRTKIVCTIGPATREPEMLRRLIQAGMDVARLNFSHGDQVIHAENIARIRAAGDETGKAVAIMMDLQGPKLRVGQMADDGVAVSQGERVILTNRIETGHRTTLGEAAAVIPVQYESLPGDVDPGDRILIDDGLIELRVEATSDTDITASVVTGGVIQNNKGLNLPGARLSIPAITEKDWDDLAFAIHNGADWIALSFVRTADEVIRLKQHIHEHCEPHCPVRVIAKIEKPQALEHIEEIIEAADGIMVARGDMGIEIAAERVPLVQKRLIRLANAAGKPVITATQMLDSMIRNPRPTRAEASDVANAILDGTDAIMLSGETAVGQYPVESVHTMVRIAREIESETMRNRWEPPEGIPHRADDVTDAVSHATCQTAHDLNVAAIIASTASGRTARNIAKYRPHQPIIAVTPNPKVKHQLMLSWGVVPLLGPRAEITDEVLRNSIRQAHQSGLVAGGARVVVTAGVTVNIPGATNLMSVELVPENP